MKRIVLLCLCILFLIIDNSVMPFICIKGAFPNLLFVFAIGYSIVNGKWEGVGIGIVSGMLQDIYFTQGFGFNSFTNLIICFMAASFGENIFRHKRFMPVISVGVFSLIKYILIFTLTYIVHIKMDFDIKSLIVFIIYNVIAMFFMYNWIYRMSNKDYMKSQWKFNK